MATDPRVASINVHAGRMPPKRRGELGMPELDGVAQQRRHGLEKLAAAFRLFSLNGFDEGVAGHITFRDPEFPDLFWVNPFGVHFSQMQVSDLILVNHHGDVVLGNHPVNRAAFAIHSRLHKARPDITAAAHSHSVHGRSFSTLGRLLDPITQDSCAFFEEQALFGEFHGVVDELDYGDDIATALGDKKTAILQNHGLLTTGTSVDMAAWLFISMDKCCKSQLLADAKGNNQPILIPEEVARKTRGQVGSEIACWVSFQPLYDMIVAKNPDLLN